MWGPVQLYEDRASQHAFKNNGNYEVLLVHTGQHYDEKMSKLFFDERQIPKPDINLEVGSGSHTVQTTETMKRFEPVVEDFQSDYVLVVGDVNSTIACGLVAVKLGVKLIHVEAGLRSFDRTMPEEINRVLTDSISDLLFVSEPSGVEHLEKEGINSGRVHFVGNVMIDTLLANREKADVSDVLQRLGLEEKGYAVITLHRPSNVDDRKNLGLILKAFDEIQQDLKLVFPVHPRTRKNFEQLGFDGDLKAMENLMLIEPVGYLDFLCLMSRAALVMTDSGGIQEETTILGVPCMTLHENTERPVTVTEGTNQLVHITTPDILAAYRDIRDGWCQEGCIPEYWDGRVASRIATIIAESN